VRTYLKRAGLHSRYAGPGRALLNPGILFLWQGFVGRRVESVQLLTHGPMLLWATGAIPTVQSFAWHRAVGTRFKSHNRLLLRWDDVRHEPVWEFMAPSSPDLVLARVSNPEAPASRNGFVGTGKGVVTRWTVTVIIRRAMLSLPAWRLFLYGPCTRRWRASAVAHSILPSYHSILLNMECPHYHTPCAAFKYRI